MTWRIQRKHTKSFPAVGTWSCTTAPEGIHDPPDRMRCGIEHKKRATAERHVERLNAGVERPREAIG